MTLLKQFKHIVPITGDTELSNIVPPGYMITDFIIENTTSNEAVIDCGSSSGGEDVFEQETIVANDTTVITVNALLSSSVRKSLFLNDDGAGSFNSSSLAVLVKMERSLI